MIINEDEYLMHYGILRRSGRYPYGSGGPEYASDKGFLGYVKQLRAQGVKDTDIAKGMGIKTTDLRAAQAIAKSESHLADVRMAQDLRDKGNSTSAIGRRMGLNESSVRDLLKPGQLEKSSALQATADMLKRQVKEKEYVDIGRGTENSIANAKNPNIGITADRLRVAVAVLKEEGYEVHYVKVPQLGTDNFTSVKVLVKPGTKYSDTYANRDKIRQITEYSEDNGRTLLGLHPPIPVDPRRVAVTYGKDGGDKADGVIYVRPGVEDLSMGGNQFSQVRVQVGDKNFLKGMAVYKNDLPAGVDLVFNTNKENTGNKLDAMKKLKDDPDNPFGSVVRQVLKVDEKGNEKNTSALNIVNDDEDWDKWSRSLSSQVLSKQSPDLTKKQLGMTYDRKKADLDEIMSLTNPVVKKQLLDSYAEDADASAVHLKAAALPQQRTHVIMPVNEMKVNEVYAPNYENGTKVALIRYPHAGTFEIPEVTVNNKNPAAKALLGTSPRAAIGLHHKVAEALSGADFDGDTVLVIPNDRGTIKTTPALAGLKNFNPQMYKIPEGSPIPKLKKSREQTEMGDITNLISDMTIRGAPTDKIARAVRHSMVVIDAEKHGLDYKGSARANGIAALKEEFQGSKRGGASTLITRAKSQARVEKRRLARVNEGGPIDPLTGKLRYVKTGETYVDAKGNKQVSTFKSKKAAETEDAYTLSSGTHMENIYAEHSNKLKALANTARKEGLAVQNKPAEEAAKKVYAKEVSSINAALNRAEKNAPLERQAQIMAGATVRAKRKANPDMEPSELKKIKSQALAEARVRNGAKKQRIDLTQEEWNAIQANAISPSKLKQVLANADMDKVRALATPRTALLMSTSKQARAERMIADGYPQAEIAQALGVSLTTLKTGLK